jgi:signal transduction histidine kinase
VSVLGIVLCVIAAWRLRIQQMQKELAVVFGERLRLSRELHDTLLQSLIGIAWQLDSAAHDLRDGPSRTRIQLTAMRKQIEDYIREAKQSIWDLRSPMLERQDLVGALRSAGAQLTAGKVDFAFMVTGTPQSCPPRVETNALRVGHEAIMNAVRHAKATHVEMEVAFDRQTLRLRVADDGCGFDMEQVSASGAFERYGLVSMRERADDVGGRCTIESGLGRGVRVTAEFPLSPSA